jgi:hypothetical protein
MIAQSSRASPGGGTHRPADLHLPVGVGEGAEFSPHGGGGQDHIGMPAVSVRKMSCTTRWSSLASAAGMDLVGVGHGRVLAQDIHALDGAARMRP